MKKELIKKVLDGMRGVLSDKNCRARHEFQSQH